MSKFCQNCGEQLDLDAKFCGVCGTILAVKEPIPEQTGLPVEASLPRQPSAAKAITITVQGIHSIAPLSGGIIAAPTEAGEIILEAKIPKIAEEVIQVINPFKVIFAGALNVIRGFFLAFKDKNKWIIALILAVVWFILTLLPILGVNNRLVQGLSWLTFAQGGMGVMGYSTFMQKAGGIIGKGVFASFVFSFFSGGNPLKKVGNGIKTMFSSYSCKDIGQIGSLIIGIGLALTFYNFMAGFAFLSMSMAGISALLLTLRALGSHTRFLRKFFGGLTAKKTEKGKSINTLIVNRVIAGMATGFALTVPLSALNTFNLPYILGAVLLIAGIVMGIVGRIKNKAVTV